MAEYCLTHAVSDLDGRELLAEGTLVTRSAMEALIGGQSNAIKTCRMIDYREVASDLIGFFETAPYDVIFFPGKRQAAILQLAREVRMPETILASLYHFRELDSYTYRHILLVFALSILIARELIDERKALLQEVIAGPTHDIGKLCVPLSILTKSTPLTPAERAHLKHHALAGHVLIGVYFRDPDVLAARVARDHHERKDGSGYPLGIPVNDLMTDIIMVSDIYDALISPRPYRQESYDNRSALEEILRQAGRGIIDPTVSRVLVALNRRSQPHYSQCIIPTEPRGTAPTKNLYGRTETEG